MAACFGKCGKTRQGEGHFWCPECKKEFKAYLGPKAVLTASLMDLSKAFKVRKNEQRLRDGFKILRAAGDR